jgi:hypothetical protein
MSTIKPFTASNIFKPLERSALFVAREVSEAAKNDPALAMRATVGVLVEPILNGVDPQILATTGQTIVPVVRAGLLGLNAVRAYNTFKNPESSTLEKGMDVIQVVSDTAGLLGGLAMLFSPQYGALGAKVLGTAYSVDIVSHSLRTLSHGRDRIKVWQAEAAALKPDTGLVPLPGPAEPPAPPKPTSLNAPLTMFEQPKQLSLWK